MSDYNEILIDEKKYLQKVTTFLEEQIGESEVAANKQKRELIELRKEMWAGGIPASDDYDRNIELTQYHTMERMETAQYANKLEKLEKYKRVFGKPYFGRVDFKEDDEELEAVYIGYQNIMNDDNYDVMVYDWRAPIASMFYRSEIGQASYTAPCGEISGEVGLKRQYEIDNSELKYFFDCSLTITDDILKDALGNNASTHMKNIVETIQKEQDIIIRDKGNDLLIVQGVAGSGKTSIAMHRIAFLLYERMTEGLTSENIMIVSPNNIFGEYVSTVLPELGEDNVKYSTMEDFFDTYFKGRVKLRSRMSQIEYTLTNRNRRAIRSGIKFKGSMDFVKMLDKLIEIYENEIIVFKDVYYAGTIIAKGSELKKSFLDNKINMAVGRRLDRIANTLEKKLRELERQKSKDLYKELKKSGSYDIDEVVQEKINGYREATLNTIRSFTRVNIFNLYQRLFKDEDLFARVSKGSNLDKGVSSIRSFTAKSLRPEVISYEDGMAMLYLRLKIMNEKNYGQIKQVLIDEAQDYYPLQYKIFAEIFKGAQFTILGDIGQTIEKNETEDLYDEVVNCISPKKYLKLSLNKSYRSSYEISKFTSKLRDTKVVSEAFERHDEVPIIAEHENENQELEWISSKVNEYQEQGFETIAIICKTQREVNHVYNKLSRKLPIHQVSLQDEGYEKGIHIMPVYMAKGLEYDAVIVYEASEQNYYEKEDKQLLYIACTRALHRLSLSYTNKLSKFLSE